jgi:DNA-binding XRE family transcriptional regulator
VEEINVLMTRLGITIAGVVLRNQVVDCACEAYGVEGVRLVRTRLTVARTEGAYSNSSLGRTLGVAHTTIGGWLGEVNSRNSDLTLNHFLQLCISMGIEPAEVLPTATDLENEFIRAGMNVVNHESTSRVTSLEPGQYPSYPEPRNHWEPVEELTLRLMNWAIGEELSDVGIQTNLEGPE